MRDDKSTATNESLADLIPKWFEGEGREHEALAEALAQIRLLEAKLGTASETRLATNAATVGQDSRRLPAEPLPGAGSPSTPSGESPAVAAPGTTSDERFGSIPIDHSMILNAKEAEKVGMTRITISVPVRDILYEQPSVLSSEAVATDKPRRWADQYDFDKSDPATRLFVAASNWMDRAERAEEELQRVKVERGELALKLAGAECFIEEQRKKGNIK